MRNDILLISSSQPDIALILDSLAQYQVTVAESTEKGLAYIESEKSFSIVLLDTSFSNDQGIEFLRTLREQAEPFPCQLLLLTSPDLLDKEILGLQLGASDYIRKPLQKESLLSRINLHMKLVQQREFSFKQNENQLLFEVFFWQAPVGIAVGQWRKPLKEVSEVLLDINPMFEKITGWSKEQLKELGWEKITYPEDLQREEEYAKKLRSGEIPSYSMEKRYIKPDGSLVWVFIIVSPFNVMNKPSCTHVCLIQDISKRKEVEHALEESERSKDMILANFPGMAYRCKLDKKWTMQFISQGCKDLTGYAPENLLNNHDLSYNDIIVPKYRKELWDEWQRVVEQKRPFKGEYEIITSEGKQKWVWEMGQVIADEQDSVVALEGIVLDISDRKKIEQEIMYRNDHDDNTGLFNLTCLKNKLLRERSEASLDQTFALVSVDLSSVHSLSTIFGFEYTQNLIKEAVSRLQTHCHRGCQLFYAYEFRFIYYVKDYSSKEELESICQIISQTLESLLTIERIGWGIGVIELNAYRELDWEHTLRYLMGASEMALRNYNTTHTNYCFFNQYLESLIDREEKITEGLLDVISGKDLDLLFLHFQPIIDLATNKISSFEALARFHSPKTGNVSPLEFIPIAERTKLIIPLGKRIIELALQFLWELRHHGHDSISVSINVSVIQLLHKDFADYLVKTIEEMNIQPSDVILEVTESVFALEIQEVKKILKKLKHSGIKIALDDFGTGYSSLARVRELNVDFLKIDKLFIDKLLILDEEDTITADVISIAHKLDQIAIAEGVESEKQLHYLKKFGCNKIQGYITSKPLEPEAAIAFIHSYENR